MIDEWRSLHRYASEALVSATAENIERSTAEDYLNTAETYGERALKVGNRGEQLVTICFLVAVRLNRLELDR